jgi:hypothetical protein
MNHWMFNCKDVSLKVSESLDRKLPLYQRMMIRIHMMMCRYCSRFRQQLLLVRQIARYAKPLESATEDSVKLSEGARARLKQTLKSASAET